MTNDVVDFRQWLPKAMRETRWADIVEVFQKVAIDEVKPTALDTMRARLFFNTMSDADLLDLAFKFGFNITQGNGYTATARYLRKEAQTILARIKNKTTRKAYPYEFYIFNMIGEVYPLRRYSPIELRPKLDWTTSLPFQDEFRLDEGRTLDESPGWTLDNNSVLGSFTRHFLLQFTPQFIEDADNFFTVDTMTAFLQDVEQVKKATEFPHFELVLPVAGSTTAQSVSTKVFQNEDQNVTAHQETVLAGGDLSQVRYLRFGNGAASGLGSMTPASNPVSGSLIQQVDITDATQWVVEAQTAAALVVRTLIQSNTKFLANAAYSEIAFHDAANNLILYTKFPRTNWDSRQLTTIQIQASLS